MSSLNTTKLADQRTKDIVNGFIKQYQKLLSKNNIYHYNIPSLIQNLCLNYYWIKEYFTFHGVDIILNKDKTIAKMKQKTVQEQCKQFMAI